jgi:hypothetical protein
VHDHLWWRSDDNPWWWVNNNRWRAMHHNLSGRRRRHVDHMAAMPMVVNTPGADPGESQRSTEARQLSNLHRFHQSHCGVVDTGVPFWDTLPPRPRPRLANEQRECQRRPVTVR